MLRASIFKGIVAYIWVYMNVGRRFKCVGKEKRLIIDQRQINKFSRNECKSFIAEEPKNAVEVMPASMDCIIFSFFSLLCRKIIESEKRENPQRKKKMKSIRYNQLLYRKEQDANKKTYKRNSNLRTSRAGRSTNIVCS